MTKEDTVVSEQGGNLPREEDQWRAHIKKSAKVYPPIRSLDSSLIGTQAKFYLGDRVWLDPGGSMPREGPYLVAAVKGNGKYALCHDDDAGTPVHNADEKDESKLRLAS
ncbi:hypothetical protein B0T25DRAFT_572417 [Lasiosphaeria hispida]|uniref:Uncharacterized protein n=1 Tax=Lasiosphaeria hispida TaxID=260671 RepID=A0AAJ0H7U4_9PEZI|nr:hypothetical protein B0T25DRAFT_572417 [Lasiosphaeria hispida]